MCAGTSGKYLVEQGLNIFKFSKQHKFFWSNLANKLRKSNVIWILIVSRHAQTQLLCWFESTMATDQNIKNKTLALESDTAYSKYGTW